MLSFRVVNRQAKGAGFCLEPPTSLGGLACFSLSLTFLLAIGLGRKKARQLRGARLRQAMLAKQAKTVLE